MRKTVYGAVGFLALGGLGAFLMANYAVRHPDSWVGRLAFRSLRVASGANTCEGPCQVACDPGPRAKVEEGNAAPRGGADVELLEVIEPIIVEPPVGAPQRRDVVRVDNGVEECELPPYPVALAPQQSAPRRMPLSDEVVTQVGGCECPLAQAVDALMRKCCGMLWPGCKTVLEKVLPAPAGAAEEAEAVETLPYPREAAVGGVKAYPDPHGQYCPYHGHCPAPFQYRYVEIPPAPTTPSVPATMPPAEDRAEEQEGVEMEREVLPEPRRED